MSTKLWTIQEAAAALGTDRFTVAGLIRAHGIETKSVPRSGVAKGLDQRDLAILAKALGQRQTTEPASAPA